MWTRPPLPNFISVALGGLFIIVGVFDAQLPLVGRGCFLWAGCWAAAIGIYRVWRTGRLV